MDILANYFHIIVAYLVILIDKIGYFGIFIGMFLESTFIPIPSEAIMIPAGMAVAAGQFNLFLAILAGVVGNLFGALFNYTLGAYFGRKILFIIGKYFFLSEKMINKIESFFKRHGSFSIFVGRLIPGIRHYISLPAGVAKMDLRKFCLYTVSGSAIWVFVLTYIGFLIGEHQELIKEYLGIAILVCITLCVLLTISYVWFIRITQTNK